MVNQIYDKHKILVLIPNFLPGFKIGGPLTSILNMMEHLSEEFYFEILTSDRDFGDIKPYEKLKKNVWLNKKKYKVFYLSSNFLFFFRILKQINSSKAEILYLNSLFNPLFSIFIVLAKKIRLINKKIIIAPRGETYFDALNFKRKKKKIYISVSKIFGIYNDLYWHASTEFEKQSIIKTLNIKPNLIRVALNLSQKINNSNINNLITKKSNNDLHIIFLSRISKDKNILFTFEILNNIKSNVTYHIYGPIEDEFIWDDCKKKINKLPKNISVEYKGSIEKNNVTKIFEEYDLMFLPSFGENYGHVIVESLSVGTPVLLSDKTPWRNLSNKGLGWDIPLNEPDKFVTVIEFMAHLTIEEKKQMKLKTLKNSLEFLNDSKLIEDYKKIFKF